METKKPRLLLMAKKLKVSPREIKRELSKRLDDKCDIRIEGYTAYGFTADELLNWAILGRKPANVEGLVDGGCDIYVGLTTPESEYKGVNASDEFDEFQLGERGYLLALESRLPAILCSVLFIKDYQKLYKKISEFASPHIKILQNNKK